jgi:hypothetical protein
VEGFAHLDRAAPFPPTTVLLGKLVDLLQRLLRVDLNPFLLLSVLAVWR